MSEEVVAVVAPAACCCFGCVTQSLMGPWRLTVFVVVLIVKFCDLGFNILLMVDTLDELKAIDTYMLANDTNNGTIDWNRTRNIEWNKTLSSNWDNTLETNATWNRNYEITLGTNATLTTNWTTDWNTIDIETFCNFDTDFDISEKVDLFKTLFTTFQVYVGVAGFIIVFYITTWCIIYQKCKGEENQGGVWKAIGKFQVYLALSYDIPMNTMAIEMQWLKGGTDGIDCWLCSKISTCSDMEPLRLESPLRIFSDNQQERTAAELWLTLGLSSVSAFVDMISVASPYFLSTSFCYFMCCARSIDDPPGKGCLAWYVFTGIFAGIHVQMTNLTLLYFHLLPQGDFPWVFGASIMLMIYVAYGSIIGDIILTICGSSFWCIFGDMLPTVFSKRLAYHTFFLSMLTLGFELLKMILPLRHPKNSYIMIMVVGGIILTTWTLALFAALTAMCCDSKGCMTVFNLLTNQNSSNKVNPSTVPGAKFEAR
ncbi:uncharacterized protein LOC106156739 [Lingula anatina]|uniref:Uncharacterized protein LOC106156739 n=1 Tax=Lingula anatina TaxID=7574 RepID=A0A1S3HNF9_LINAN|nr:uncharacterized protein LOC106156739 [Lingula anatina]|eukprot:XP_013387598.1 uncharacterized protein LOC106156739 [Lingula anatina]